MGKTHHRRIKQSEQDHEGWMSGFISLFDFRRGGSHHRLLPDKSFGNKVHGSSSSSSEGFSQDMTGSVKNSQYIFDEEACESSQPMLCAGQQSVKNLAEEDSYLEFVDFANDANINRLVREILVRIQQKSSGRVEQEQNDNFCILPEKSRAKFVKQLTDATKVLLHEKLIGRMPVGLDGRSQYSREFIDALEILISHKDLFFKLLEDPNSELTRRINDLINSELVKCADQRESEGLHHRKLSLFSKRRVRSQDVMLLSVDKSSEVSRSNAFPQPGSETLSSSYSVNSSELGSKTKSSFSFTEIKRRLKRVMGKDREDVFSKNEMARSKSRRDSFGRMTPSTNPHLEVEIHPKRLSNSEWSDVRSTEKSDMASVLTDEITYDKFSKRRDLEFTRKSFSMTDRNRSPSSSPARQSSMPTAHIKLSFHKKSLSSNDDSHVPEQENSGNAAIELSDHSLVVASCGPDDKWCADFESDDPSPMVSENVVFGDGDDEGKFSIKSSSADKINAGQDKQDATDQDCTAPSQTISADSFLGSDKSEQLDDVTSRIDNRTSPTSVLEPEYPDDEIRPPGRKNSKGELPVAPLEIHFEDEEHLSESDSNTSPFGKKLCDDNETKLKKYIKEILTASDFSWDTFYLRYLSSDQLLDISDAEVDINSDQPSNDYMLLLDLLNEVLIDSCARYFGCSPWASLSKPNIRPIPNTENTFQEISEGVESHLHPSPHTQGVNQIVAKEIFKDGRWTDFPLDVETIGTEIADLILQKLLVETAFSCFSFTDKPRLVHS